MRLDPTMHIDYELDQASHELDAAVEESERRFGKADEDDVRHYAEAILQRYAEKGHHMRWSDFDGFYWA